MGVQQEVKEIKVEISDEQRKIEKKEEKVYPITENEKECFRQLEL